MCFMFMFSMGLMYLIWSTLINDAIDFLDLVDLIDWL